MKRLFISAIVSLACLTVAAQDIVKTGLNFGPLPVVAFDADKGLQYGALLNIYNFGDGSNYPNYNSKIYAEASFFTKGSSLFNLSYDAKELIPGIRWSSALSLALDKAMDFYGFNGYESYYDYKAVASGKAGDSFIFTPFYKVARKQLLAKTDFIGDITEHFKWEVGYHASWFKEGAIDRESINKGKEDSEKYPGEAPTLFELYRQAGVISDTEADGGFSSGIRLGLVYDSRDKEGAPTRGIWAEGHIHAAPKWLGTKNPFYRYSLTFRQYLPIVKNDVLTFAYRLNYEGTFGSNAPYYVLPYITVMGENYDRDGMGGYRNVRGMLRNRVVGLDMFTYTAELRWRFLQFRAFNQNIALGLSAFSDGSTVTRGRDMKDFAKQEYGWGESVHFSYKNKLNVAGQEKDSMHITMGAGFRFIMNENFIVAFEYGTPLSHFRKNSPVYNQDGTGAMYINIGYLF
ncbi:MAG: BamA/TamA family outer membrane protein [Bacteroidales bacterium]|nr:BamA/TamA family outer membrane protein [Bacteroidales bacterium]